MNELGHSAPVSDEAADPLHVAWAGLPADPGGATLARTELAKWLQSHVALDDDRGYDVVLAVYEALANAVEASLATDATTDVAAVYDRARRILTVTVADRGEWSPPSSKADTTPAIQRGRGIPLMRALADHVQIDISDGGTTVALTWTDVVPLSANGD